MEYTNHYNLNKPELSEQYNLSHWNDNMTAIDNALYNEATTRANAINTINNNKVNNWQTTPDHAHYPSEKLVKDSIDGESNTRANEDTILQNKIDNEIENRTNADSILQDNISNESTARANADTSIMNTFIDSFLGMIQYFMRINEPSGWKKCDGTMYSKNTFPALHEKLYNQFIGSRAMKTDQFMVEYNNNDFYGDSSFFISPNYIRFPKMTSYSEDGGYFLRGGTDGNIGQSQEDKIRDIVSSWNRDNSTYRSMATGNTPVFGGARADFITAKGPSRNDDSYYQPSRVVFDANLNTQSSDATYGSVTNPMAGHADGKDIHPANITALPCIFVGVFS